MKTFACVVLIAAVAAAEPPRYRQDFRFQRQELDRETTTPSSESAPYPAAGFRPAKAFNLPNEQESAAPSTSYQGPNSFAPRQEYGVPNRFAPRQEYGPPGVNSPSTSYGAPENSNAAPQIYPPRQEYGVPNSPITSYGAPENSNAAPQIYPPRQEYGVPNRLSTEYGAPTEAEGSGDDLKVEGLTKEKLELAPNKDAEVLSNQGAYYVLLPGSQLQRVQFETENDLRNMAYTARLQYKNEDRAPLYVYNAVPQYQPSAAYVQLY